MAARESCIVVMTGEADFVSNGTDVLEIRNGHKLLREVTGTGCCLGTAISAAVAAMHGDLFIATIGAILHYEIAAEIAAERSDVKGPGTFVPAFLDELYAISQASIRGENGWALERAKVFRHTKAGAVAPASSLGWYGELDGWRFQHSPYEESEENASWEEATEVPSDELTRDEEVTEAR